MAPVGCYMVVFGSLAAFLNSLIIAAVYRSPFLKLKCNFLMASLAICDGTLGCGLLVMGLQMLTKQILSGCTCFWLLSWSILADSTSSALMFGIGVDRALALGRPHVAWYSGLQCHRYLASLLLPSFCYGMSVVIFGAIGADCNVHVPICLTPTALQGPVHTYWMASYMFWNLLTIGVYSYVYWLVRRQPCAIASSASFQRKAKLTISLLIVFLAYISCRVAPILLVLLARVANVSESVSLLIQAYGAGILFTLSVHSNFLIYASRSGNFHNEFRNIFGLGTPSECSSHFLVSSERVDLIGSNPGHMTHYGISSNEPASTQH